VLGVDALLTAAEPGSGATVFKGFNGRDHGTLLGGPAVGRTCFSRRYTHNISLEKA
jgi:hypothetical protein